jgi:hypothetical protein
MMFDFGRRAHGSSGKCGLSCVTNTTSAPGLMEKILNGEKSMMSDTPVFGTSYTHAGHDSKT